jgi:hypothetical protein
METRARELGLVLREDPARTLIQVAIYLAGLMATERQREMRKTYKRVLNQ